MQKGAPEKNGNATQGYVESNFVQVKQDAEQALSKEEIPAGSKEFVREYFSSLEPEKEGQKKP